VSYPFISLEQSEAQNHAITYMSIDALLLALQVLFAASLLKNNKAAHEALMSAMSQKASVLGCIEAIESAS